MKNNDSIAYCGLYCPMCSLMTTYQTGDTAHLQAMPERYDRFKSSPLDECNCSGCKLDDYCGDCAIKDCAEQKGYTSCADCADMPCSFVSDFANDGMPHHADALRNLYRIKEAGYDKWLQEMQAMMHCSCGARQSWYYKCPQHSLKG